MDTEKKEIEMKVRSSQACIRDGYQLYSANFRKIFRATWWLAIGFALLAAVAQALPVLISPTLLLPASILAIVAVGLWLAAAKWRLKKLQMLPDATPGNPALRLVAGTRRQAAVSKHSMSGYRSRSGTINHPAYGDTDYCQLAVAGRHALRRPIGYAREREMAEHRGIRHSRLYPSLRMADDGAAHVSG